MGRAICSRVIGLSSLSFFFPFLFLLFPFSFFPSRFSLLALSFLLFPSHFPFSLHPFSYFLFPAPFSLFPNTPFNPYLLLLFLFHCNSLFPLFFPSLDISLNNRGDMPKIVFIKKSYFISLFAENSDLKPCLSSQRKC